MVGKLVEPQMPGLDEFLSGQMSPLTRTSFHVAVVTAAWPVPVVVGLPTETKTELPSLPLWAMTSSPLLLRIWLPGRPSSLVTQLTAPPPRHSTDGFELMTGVKLAPS